MYNTFIGGITMDILLEVLEETIVMLPMLLVMYFLLEYYEMHNLFVLNKYKRLGPLLGAVLGLIPQCGISVLASLSFLERKISLGTLMSVYIATSDEAIPLLLSNYALRDDVVSILIIKFIAAVIFGYFIDMFIHFEMKERTIHNEHLNHSLWKCVLERTLKVYLFIFIVHLALSYLFEFIGEEFIAGLLLNKNSFQPLLTSLFGLIPHCIVSIVLTGLYSKDLLSFASLIAGLMSNAGLGLIALLRYKIDIKDFIRIVGLLTLCSMTVGLFLQFI